MSYLAHALSQPTATDGCIGKILNSFENNNMLQFYHFIQSRSGLAYLSFFSTISIPSFLDISLSFSRPNEIGSLKKKKKKKEKKEKEKYGRVHAPLNPWKIYHNNVSKRRR